MEQIRYPLVKGIIALLNSETRMKSIETIKRLHGEVCLDEIYSLFSSIQFNNGTIGKDFENHFKPSSSITLQ